MSTLFGILLVIAVPLTMLALAGLVGVYFAKFVFWLAR
jgi:hypothetical protein